jgi:hypothetical protein
MVIRLFRGAKRIKSELCVHLVDESAMPANILAIIFQNWLHSDSIMK